MLTGQPLPWSAGQVRGTGEEQGADGEGEVAGRGEARMKEKGVRERRQKKWKKDIKQKEKYEKKL